MKLPDEMALRYLSPRTLGLILLPTEQCNFRCTYCYEDFALGRMSPAVVRGVKALLAARAPTLDDLILSWFGGEPLLALDIVEDVQAHAQALAREFPGLRVGGSMTTNAWKLAPGVFARLLALGVDDYQISFDGPPEHHDKKRVRADGRPTFERLWRNVLAMRERDEPFKIRLRLHVDRDNLEAMFPFVERCRDAFGGDPRFVLFLKPLSRYGGRNDANLPLLASEPEWRRFAELERSASRPRGPLRPDDPPPLATLPDEACYAARGNHFVVRSDGRLCKCTIILDDPRNQVGRLHEDGTVEISGDAMRPWMRGLWSGVTSERLCPLRGFPAHEAAVS